MGAGLWVCHEVSWVTSSQCTARKKERSVVQSSVGLQAIVDDSLPDMFDSGVWGALRSLLSRVMELLRDLFVDNVWPQIVLHEIQGSQNGAPGRRKAHKHKLQEPTMVSS